MFIGHAAVALAAKRVAPQVSLGTMLLAVFFLDALWPAFLLLDWESVEIRPGDTAFTPLAFTHYPWSHSLMMAIAWSVLVGGAFFGVRRDPLGAVWVGLAVTSHWVLDFVSHRADLPLAPGSDVKVGLGLWNSVPATLGVEGALFLAALSIYMGRTRARDATGRWAFAVLIAFFLAAYIGNILGPPPPSVNALAAVSLCMWLLVPWGYWIDRHREARA